MATQIYRLTCVLYLYGLNAGTRHEAVSIIADSVKEAIDLANLYRASLPSAALSAATLTDAVGAVISLEQNSESNANHQRKLKG